MKLTTKYLFTHVMRGFLAHPYLNLLSFGITVFFCGALYDPLNSEAAVSVLILSCVWFMVGFGVSVNTIKSSIEEKEASC